MGNGVSRFYSSNGTFNGSYHLGTGLSDTSNCIMSYVLNWVPVVCLCTGVGAGVSTSVEFLGTAFMVSFGCAVGGSIVADVVCNAIRDVNNHNFELGSFLKQRIYNGLTYMSMFNVGYGIGYQIKFTYNLQPSHMTIQSSVEEECLDAPIDEPLDGPIGTTGDTINPLSTSTSNLPATPEIPIIDFPLYAFPAYDGTVITTMYGALSNPSDNNKVSIGINLATYGSVGYVPFMTDFRNGIPSFSTV